MMNDHSQPFEDTSPHTELSGDLLESVREILREPIEQEDVVRALNRARRIAQAMVLDRPRPTQPLSSQSRALNRFPSVILSHKRLSIAAVAVIALAASLIFHVFLFSFSVPVYAVEQTVEANSHITSYHVKVNPPSSAMGVGEAWIQLAPDGTPLRGRMNLFGGERGDRVAIVSKSMAEFWWKAKNCRVVCGDKWVIEKALEQCTTMRALFDPKLAFEQLRADEEAGKVQVATKRPARDGEPITLTVTSKGDPNRRYVYEVDPHSKLVARAIECRGCGEQWKQVLELDFLDYSQEIDPKVFQPAFSNDITTIDPSKIDFGKLGLAESQLTDDQIAAKLAKEFFETLLAGDYKKLGQLNDVRTATWKTTSVAKGPGRETETATGIGMFLTPARERIEKTSGGRTKIVLVDSQKDHSMTLFPKAKTAIVSRFRNPPPAYAHGTAFLSVRKSIADARRSAEWLGIETVDGRRAEGFRFKHGDGERTVWADPKTSFPIRVEEVSLVGSNETCTIMTDFQFNLDLDESLFGLDVPAGYAIRTMQVDFSKQPIDYFVDSLRFAAEHNDGLFPPTLLGEQGLADTVRRAIAALEKAHGQDSPEMFDLGGEIAMNKDKAFAFLSNLSPKSDWHYVGRDVKLYTPGKPIFWHKPMGTVNYRVVCADLKVKELSLDAFQFPFGPPATRLGDDQFEVAFSYRPDKKVQSVYLAGSFNNWKPMAHKMDGPDEDGSFTALLKLKQGTYEYKFVLDGHTWETDPNNIWQSGRNGNSEAHVGLLFGSVGKPLGDDQFEVAFSYRPDKKVQSVYLAGSFNNWKPMAHKMDGPDKDGRFTTLLKLKQGTYEYKFVLDGQIWEADPDNTWRTSWYQNSLLYVGNPP